MCSSVFLHMQLGKLDIETGTTKKWSEDGCLPSEPVFIGAPEGQDEDDGWYTCRMKNQT